MEKHIVAYISSETVGIGNDELGRLLMKGFIKNLRASTELPNEIIFLNGGVKLTASGSDMLEDLQALAARGVRLRSCGTCLDFYGVRQQLAVGEATTMAATVETLMKADHVVRP